MDRSWCWHSCDILLGIFRVGESPAAVLLNDDGITAELVESVIETEGTALFLDDAESVSASR